MNPGTKVTYKGRPAVTITPSEVGAHGKEIIGVRFEDVERWIVDGKYERPNPDAHAIAKVAEVAVRS